MHYKHFLTVQGILKLCDISHVHFDKTNLVSCNLLLQDEKGLFETECFTYSKYLDTRLAKKKKKLRQYPRLVGSNLQ